MSKYEKYEAMERMNRKKIYYLLANEKQTLVSCDYNGKEISNILKFDGNEWVPDNEVYEVVIRCFKIDVMDKIAMQITSDYEYDKILNAKKEHRKLADQIAHEELLARIEKRDAEKADTNTTNTDDTKK